MNAHSSTRKLQLRWRQLAALALLAFAALPILAQDGRDDDDDRK